MYEPIKCGDIKISLSSLASKKTNEQEQMYFKVKSYFLMENNSVSIFVSAGVVIQKKIWGTRTTKHFTCS